MKNILLLSICILTIFSCKKEKPKTENIEEPVVDYREKYLGEYVCSGFYEVYIKGQNMFQIDTFDIIYNIEKSGDSSIIVEGLTLKIEKDGYFGPKRPINTKFALPPHGQFSDTSILYARELAYYDSLKSRKRLHVYGLKTK